MSTRKITLTALLTALICILAPMSIPIGPVPVSLTVFAVFLAAGLLGGRGAALAYLVYLLLGLVGLPVFSGYTGGPQKLFGPTGGYLIGMLPMALLAGFFIRKFQDNLLIRIAGVLLSLACCYAFGTAWLAFSAHMGLKEALWAGVIPFIPLDLLKIAAAGVITRAVLPRLSPLMAAPM